MSTRARPIKVTNTACLDLERFRDTGNTKNISITGKVTSVVAVMTILSKHKKFSTALNREVQAKALKSLKSKKIAPDRAKKKLKLANSSLIHAKKHEKDDSKRLIVKNKTIRVLLDSELSGDLLFI